MLQDRVAIITGGGRGIGAELDLGIQNRVGAARIHYQQHKVGGLAANLQTEAAAFQREHGGCAPVAIETRA